MATGRAIFCAAHRTCSPRPPIILPDSAGGAAGLGSPRCGCPRICRGSERTSITSSPRARWVAYGVTLADSRPLPGDDLPASLLLPMGRFGPAFLAYDNFRVYLQWNNALVYSTTAAYLATRITGAPPLHRGTCPAALGLWRYQGPASEL